MLRIQKLTNLFLSVFNYSKNDWNNLENYLSPLGTELLRHSLNHEDLTDEEAAHLLLRTDLKDPNFKRIKKGLRKSLFAEILRFSPSIVKYSAYQRNYYQDNKLLAAFKILRGLSKADLSKYLASQLHRRSKVYHFTEIRLETSRYLYNYYTSIRPNVKLGEEYRKEVNDALKQYNLETEVELLFHSIFLVRLDSSKGKNRIEKKLNEIRGYDQYVGTASVSFHKYYFAAKEIIYDELGDYKSALKIAQEALFYFESLEFDNRPSKKIWLNSLSYWYLKFGQITEAKQVLQKRISIQSHKDRSWYALQMVLTKLHFQTLKFEEASAVYKNVVASKKNNSLPKNFEVFNRQSQVLFFFITHTHEVSFESQMNYKKAVLFLQESKDFDLPSLYFAFIFELILGILFKENVSDESLQEIYKLRDKQRLIKKNPHFRSLCFLNMLLAVLESDYHIEAIKRKTLPYQEKLQSKELIYDHDIEIIPFEYIWEVIMNDIKEVALTT